MIAFPQFVASGSRITRYFFVYVRGKAKQKTTFFEAELFPALAISKPFSIFQSLLFKQTIRRCFVVHSFRIKHFCSSFTLLRHHNVIFSILSLAFLYILTTFQLWFKIHINSLRHFFPPHLNCYLLQCGEWNVLERPSTNGWLVSCFCVSHFRKNKIEIASPTPRSACLYG